MQRALAKVLGEMPDVKPVTISPSSSSILSKLFAPKGSMATTNPFTGNISYNPDAFQGQSQDELENTVAHELTHSRQAQNTPWYKTAVNLFRPDDNVPTGINQNSPLNTPYYWRPREMEAFQTERNRQTYQPYPVDPALGTRDIQLSRPKKQIDVGPSNLKR
jgi:hypothetical protein